MSGSRDGSATHPALHRSRAPQQSAKRCGSVAARLGITEEMEVGSVSDGIRKRRFKIGDWVHVTSETVKTRPHHSKRSVAESDVSLFGQIVGIGKLYSGKVESDFEYGNYFVPSKCHEVWLVRTGMMNRPIMAKDDGIEKTPPRKLPLMNSRYQWEDSQREEMRKIANETPRNSKGQWLSYREIQELNRDAK